MSDLLRYAALGISGIIVIILFSTVLMLKTEGSKCLEQPLVYGVNWFEENNRVTLFCTCSMFSDTSSNLPLISITRVNMTIFYPTSSETRVNNSEYNYSRYILPQSL